MFAKSTARTTPENLKISSLDVEITLPCDMHTNYLNKEYRGIFGNRRSLNLTTLLSLSKKPRFPGLFSF